MPKLQEEIISLRGKLKKCANDLLNKSLTTDSIAGKSLYKTSLEYNNITNERLVNFCQPKSPSDYTFFAFGHLASNPSMPRRSKFLLKAYCCNNNSFGTVNCNAKSSFTFFKELFDASRNKAKLELQNLDDTFGVVARDVYILHGPRGAGKTFFLNYLLTAYSKLLDKKKCIWIRVSMVEQFDYNKAEPVLTWLMQKLIKILLNYYNRDSSLCSDEKKHVDTIGIIKRYIDNKIYQNEQNRADDYRALDRLYKSIIRNREERTSKVHQTIDHDYEFGTEMINVLRQKGYHFIFIIDGMDRLDVSPIYREKFRTVMHALSKMLNNSGNKYSGIFLLVCRTESLIKIKNYLKETRPVGIQLNIIERQLGIILFENIINKRMYILPQLMEKICAEKQWSFDEWLNLYNLFQSYIANSGNYNTLKSYIIQQEAIFGENHRAKVQTLQIAYHDFLKTQTYKKRYQLVELMCKGGFDYPIAPEFSIDKNGNIQNIEKGSFDTVFFPNVFWFPYNDKQELYDDKADGLIDTNLLAGIELLSVIMSYQDLLKSTGVNEKISAKKIASIMKDALNYDKTLTYNLIVVFCEFELLKLNGIAFSTSEVAAYNVYVMPKTLHLFNTLLGDIAYLNMCSMTTPYKEQLFREQYIVPTSIDAHGPDQFATNKIFNGINMIRIICSIVKIEHEKLRNRIIGDQTAKKIIINAKDHWQLHNPFSDKHKNYLTKQINGIIDSIENIDLLNRMLSRFESFLK
jgi:hypothetical protein